VPDHHNQGADDDTAAYHCAPDHDKRVRITAAPHGRPHARYNNRAGDDGAAADDDGTAAAHIHAGNDVPAPGYDRTGHDALTRDYRRAGNYAPPEEPESTGDDAGAGHDNCARYDGSAADYDQLGDYADVAVTGGYDRAKHDLGPPDYDGGRHAGGACRR